HGNNDRPNTYTLIQHKLNLTSHSHDLDVIISRLPLGQQHATAITPTSRLNRPTYARRRQHHWNQQQDRQPEKPGTHKGRHYHATEASSWFVHSSGTPCGCQVRLHSS